MRVQCFLSDYKESLHELTEIKKSCEKSIKNNLKIISANLYELLRTRNKTHTHTQSTLHYTLAKVIQYIS